MSRQAQGSHGINEACCQTAQTTITQTSIRLLIIEVMQMRHIRIISHQGLQGILNIQVQQIGIQKTANQELNGEIINLLIVVLSISLVGSNPVLSSILLSYLCNNNIQLVISQVAYFTAILNHSSLNNSFL